LTFALSLPPQYKQCRLKAIGGSISSDNAFFTDPQWRYVKGTLVVFPPIPPDLFSGKPRVQPTPVHLQNVAINDPHAAVRMLNTGDFVNIDPNGTWTVQVGKILGLVDYRLPTRSSATIQNVYLHMLLSARLESDPSQWHGLAW
jgi:hypothetical protein